MLNCVSRLLVVFAAVFIGAVLCSQSSHGASGIFSNPGPVARQLQAENGEFGAVNQLIQDTDGYIWMATRQGLVKFDGFRMERFTKQSHGLPHNFIIAMVTGTDGSLWVGTRSGLARLNSHTLNTTLFDSSALLAKKRINALAMGRGNQLWIGTRDGLMKMDIGTGQVEDTTSLFGQNVRMNISSVLEDSHGYLWAVDRGKALYRHHLQSGKFDRFAHDPADASSLDGNLIQAVFESRKGDLWFASDKGLNRLRPSSKGFERFSVPKHPANTESTLNLNGLAEDLYGNLWISSRRNGVAILPAGQQQVRLVNPDGISQENTLPGLIWRTLFADRSGAVWLSDLGGNLWQVQPSATLFDSWIRAAKGQGNLLSVYSDSSHRRWIGIDKNLYQYDLATGKFIEALKGIGHVVNMLEDAQGNLLLNASGAGVFVYQPDTGKVRPLGPKPGEPGGLPTKKTNAIALDEQGTIWVGMYNSPGKISGVYSYNAQQNQYVQHLDKFTVATLLPLQSHVLIGTRRNGLQILDKATGQWQRLDDDTQTFDRIWQIKPDSQGRIWLSSNDAGLVRLDWPQQTLQFVLPKPGGLTSRVMGFVEDRNGFLWLGTGAGIVRYNAQTGDTLALERSIGLRVNSMGTYQSSLAANGDVLLGGYNGLTQLNVDNIVKLATRQTGESQLMLSDFRLFNRPVDLSDGPIDKVINATDKVVLGYENRWFSLAFSSSNYAQLDRVKYAYQMQGFNDGWIETDKTNRIASFTGLPPNEYILKIKASHADGSWSPEIRQLDIIITPPWWQTWQAYTAYVVLAFLVIFGVFQYRTRALIARANQLEQGVIERTATINELMNQKERMFANISHEFKTPLTLILNPLDALMQKANSEEEGSKMTMMKRNGQRLLRMVDQLLELSKLETASNDKMRDYSLADTLDMLLTSFEPLFESKHLTLDKPAFDDVVLSLKIDSLEMILTNLISNAIKYTLEEGHIIIQVTRESSAVVIAISDTGIGIDEENQKLVFNRFTRANDKHESIPGAGIGLALVKELVRSNGGTITLQSTVGKGSTFTVTLPVSDADPATIEKLGGPSASSLIEIDAMSQTPQVVEDTTSQVMDENAPTLLLIDDNADMLTLLVDTLSNRFQCMTAPNGEQGLELAKEHLPDLVISDVMMPGISGYEVVKTLKETEMTCHIPVILLTAKGDVQSRIEGWSNNADEYLQKPFNSVELNMRIDNLLSIRKLLRQRYQREFTTPTGLPGPISDSGVQTDEAQDSTQIEGSNLVNQQFFDKVNAILEAHYADEKLDVSLLASHLAMSSRQLGRKMKSLLDLTPAESIRSFRLKKAAQLLREGQTPSIVAHQVGFSSHSYFSQCFKAQFNCMPSVYAEQNLGVIGA